MNIVTYLPGCVRVCIPLIPQESGQAFHGIPAGGSESIEYAILKQFQFKVVDVVSSPCIDTKNYLPLHIIKQHDIIVP